MWPWLVHASISPTGPQWWGKWCFTCLYISWQNAQYAVLPYAQSLSCVRLFSNPMDCSPLGSSVHWVILARILEGGCHFLLQGTFPEKIQGRSSTQGSNLSLQHLLHWQADSLPLSHQGSPRHEVDVPQTNRLNEYMRKCMGEPQSGLYWPAAPREASNKKVPLSSCSDFSWLTEGTTREIS